jgi:CheY-like chemotaxis protein
VVFTRKSQLEVNVESWKRLKPEEMCDSPSKKAELETCNIKENASEVSIEKWEKSLKFLIVDDTTTNRKLTRRILTNFGHLVEDACDGLEFLNKLNINLSDNVCYKEDTTFPHYDVVLLDDNMPNMSGPHAASLARKYGYTGLIIGVTGHTYTDGIKKFLSSGVDEVFAKPLDFSALKLCVETRMKALAWRKVFL